MHLPRGQSLTIGRRGTQAFARGWYLYVGSAFGPGGVAARCHHHRNISPRPRWHVDYLRRAAPLRAIWYCHSAAPLEHRWAEVLAGNADLSAPIAGFGASDCDCFSHLFRANNRPDLGHFSTLLQSQSGQDDPVYCEIL
jgi:Uri superfamily endonuclease